MEGYIKNRVDNDPRITKAKQGLYSAISTGNMLLISNAQGKINKLKEDLTKELVKEFEKSEASLSELKLKLSEEDYKKSLFYSGAINYLIDWIDLMVTDINSIVSKAFPGGRIEIWDNILKLGEEAKVQLNALHKGAEAMSVEIAENSDELFERVMTLIKGKATKSPEVGDKVTLKDSNDTYIIKKIDRRRKDKYSLQKEGQIPMWVNENNINF